MKKYKQRRKFDAPKFSADRRWMEPKNAADRGLLNGEIKPYVAGDFTPIIWFRWPVMQQVKIEFLETPPLLGWFEHYDTRRSQKNMTFRGGPCWRSETHVGICPACTVAPVRLLRFKDRQSAMNPLQSIAIRMGLYAGTQRGRIIFSNKNKRLRSEQSDV